MRFFDIYIYVCVLCCILTSKKNAPKPYKHLLLPSPPVPFPHFPFFSLLSLGIQSRNNVAGNLSSMYSCNKAGLLRVIVCPWNDVDAISFTVGCECWACEWGGEGGKTVSKSWSTYGDDWSCGRVLNRQTALFYGFLMPFTHQRQDRRWKMETNNGKLICLQNGTKEMENMADMR